MQKKQCCQSLLPVNGDKILMPSIFLDIAIDEIYIQDLPIICMVDQNVKDVIYKFFTNLRTGRIQSSLSIVSLDSSSL